MKILKLLSKFFTIFLFIFFSSMGVKSDEKPVDIWNIDKSKIDKDEKENEVSNIDQDKNKEIETDVYKTNSINTLEKVTLDENLNTGDLKIVGLYDPELNGLKISMWENTDGDQLKNIFKNLNKMNLSEDSKELLNIALLTNAHHPQKNISLNEFLRIKSNWLIKNSDLDLLENYIITNQLINDSPVLVKYLVDQHLSQSNLEKSCKIFEKINQQVEDKYLSKFNIYCLVNMGKLEEAQLIFDLKKETGFKDIYFENKINFLFGFEEKVDEKISKKSILDFHLAHKTIPNFNYEPDNDTPKLIWKYLSTSNLLPNIKEIDINQIDKISLREKATHDKNYSEKELFDIYKRFQFNINQLLNIKNSHKLLSNIESRALIYQGILITTEVSKKIELMKMLKDSFEKEKMGNAFDEELRNFLSEINIEEIPSNFTDFYVTNTKKDELTKKNIRYNNKILHQSKLIKYFEEDYSKDFKKEVNDFLKKIKKNKKYFLSKKDIIFLEALKSDGIEISNRYKDLYEIIDSEMPTDIQVMINNDDIGGALLRIVEVIGRDRIEDIDDDTLYFIISTFNQLNLDPIRNKILLKILPLKV